MRLSLTATLSTLLSLCTLSPAQQEQIPEFSRRTKVDSRWLDNKTAQERVVFSQVVRLPGAPWMRLLFSKSNLPGQSYLRMTSLQDQGQLRLDAHNLQRYGESSCYFNGDAVRLELVAAPRTLANRVMVVEILHGSLNPPAHFATQSICGSRDDRVQSQDKRQGRLQVGCTGWLFGEDLFGTAGHCVSSSRSQFIEFNVPNSSGSGSIRRAHPNDQYPMIASTVAYLNNGVGKDWCVGRLNRNANTGKFAGEVQGAWYTLGKVPSSTSGQNIRITGYGSTSPRNYLYLVQKTHVGPLYNLGSTAIRYRTDTTGGNSGSPVVHENTGHVVGVHTHAGCNSSGGANQGTRIDRSDFQAAIRNLSVVRGETLPFGTACTGSKGQPALSGSSNPQINTLFAMVATNLVAGNKGFFLVGRSNTANGTLSLPFDLQAIGAAGCQLYVSMDVLIPATAQAAGYALLQSTVPNNSALVGVRLFTQYASEDAPANAAGLVSSNGLSIKLGG